MRIGERLAEEAPVDADLVMPIPDSGTPAAIGFAKRSGLPYEEGLIKNRYVGRTFIEPDQELRRQGIKLKFNPLAEIKGRRLAIVDDSIVRGNTMRALVEMLQTAGAAEVHVRISSPPVVSPCFYGIDMADEDDLAAAHRSVEEMREHVAATSLAYLFARRDAVGDPPAGGGGLPRLLHAALSDGRAARALRRQGPLRSDPGLTPRSEQDGRPRAV